MADGRLWTESAPPPEDPFKLLTAGAVEAMELIPWGSNYTFAVSLRGDDDARCLAVYKPLRGEVPLRDFPNGTLYKREVAAYRLAQRLGWDMVPPTVVRPDGPHGIGSMQLYVEPCQENTAQFDHLRASHQADLQRMALFDLLTNNADRKGGHCLLDVSGRLWGIDHGLTFHHVPKLRTVIWDYCGDPIPRHLIDDLARVRADAALMQCIRVDLESLVSTAEMEALLIRWDRLLANPCYPELDPYRHVPWPPF